MEKAQCPFSELQAMGDYLTMHLVCLVMVDLELIVVVMWLL